MNNFTIYKIPLRVLKHTILISFFFYIFFFSELGETSRLCPELGETSRLCPDSIEAMQKRARAKRTGWGSRASSGWRRSPSRTSGRSRRSSVVLIGDTKQFQEGAGDLNLP